MIQKLKTYKNLLFYRKLIRKDDLCFDIGANLGSKSQIYLSIGAKVIAFEPQTNCQKTLLEIKQRCPKFEVNQVAVGAKTGHLDLSIGNHIEIATLSNKFKSHFTSKNTFWNKKEHVKVVTLDSQIKKYGLPDFCKIDAEGYEYEILENLTYKIPNLEFEFTGGFIEETLQCLNKIRTLGNYTFNYTLYEKPKLKHKNWLSVKELSSTIKSMNTKNLHGNIFAKLNY